MSSNNYYKSKQNVFSQLENHTILTNITIPNYKTSLWTLMLKIKCKATSITTTSMFLWFSKTRAVQAQNHNVSALQGCIPNHDFSKTLLAGDSCPALAQNQAWNYTISFKTCSEHTMPFHDCSGKSPRMKNTLVLNGLVIKFVSIHMQI